MISPLFASLIEKCFGKNISSAADCENLALDILKETNQHIGGTTLRRIFGFTSDKRIPRESTLDVLALYIGYKDYETLRKSVTGLGDSDFEDKDIAIDITQLKIGSIIEIRYLPDRILRIRYEGDYNFIVVTSIGSRLKENDRLKIHSIAEGLPLHCQEVIRDGESLGSYIAGKEAGTTAVSFIN